MSLYVGLIAAAISALFWGSQFVPLKRTKNPDMLHYQFFMAAGIFAITVLLTLLFNFPFVVNYFGLAAGLVWSIGNVLQIASIKRIGISKGMPIALGMVILISFLSGVFIFKETVNPITGASGIIVFLVGIVFVSQSKEKAKSDATGLLYAFLAGAFFGSVALFFKFGNLAASEFLFAMSLGILITSLLLFLVRVRKFIAEQAKPALFSGVMWGIAMLSSLYAITFLGLAIGQPLTQLALLVGVLWGLFYFREISDASIVKKVMLGAVMLFGAGVLLTLSKVFL